MKLIRTISLLALLASTQSGALSNIAHAQSPELTEMPLVVQYDGHEPFADVVSSISLPPNWIEYGSKWIVLENPSNSEQGCVLILPQYNDVQFEQLPDDGFKFYCSTPQPTEDQIVADYVVSFSGSYTELVAFIVSDVLPEAEDSEETSAMSTEAAQSESEQEGKYEFVSTMSNGLRYRFMRGLARLIGIELNDAAQAVINAEQQAARAALQLEEAARVVRPVPPAPPLTQPSPQLVNAASNLSTRMMRIINILEGRQQTLNGIPAAVSRFITNRARWILDEVAQQQLNQLSMAEQAAFRRALNAHYNAVGDQLMAQIQRGELSVLDITELATPIRRQVMLCDEETGLFFRITGTFNVYWEQMLPISEVLLRR